MCSHFFRSPKRNLLGFPKDSDSQVSMSIRDKADDLQCFFQAVKQNGKGGSEKMDPGSSPG